MLRESSTLALMAGLAVTAHAGIGNDVIVTEVFFNPSCDEAETEWVEITNVGLIPVDVSNWRLADEDNNSPSDPFGSGAIFDPDSQTIIPGAVALGTDGCDFAGEECMVVNSVILQPGESAIVMSSWEYPAEFNQLPASGSHRDGRANTIQDFIASWGVDTDEDGFGDTVDYKIVLLLNTITIANTASDVNEVLFMIDGNGDTVNWPNYEVGRGSNQ